MSDLPGVLSQLTRTLSGSQNSSSYKETFSAASEEQASSPTKIRDRLKKLAKFRKDKTVATSSSSKDPIETPDDRQDPSESPSQGDTDGKGDATQALAVKIRNLIDALPLPTPKSSRTLPSLPKKPPARDKTGKPILPPDASRTKDEKLVSLLSNPAFMNGEGRNRRESVWSLLDSLGPPSHDTAEGGDDEATPSLDDSSIMMYAPLVPTNESVVELAETQLVSPAVAHTPVTQALSIIQTFSFWPPKFWPFTSWNNDGENTDPAPTSPAPPTNNPQPTSPAPVRVWVPSKEKLSFQIMWWGYRIYLPPPVLAILSDKQLEATKRAAMITTALTWFFSHIPVTALPPPIQPAVLLLQKLVPFVGYIGTFISWSWSTIKSYDIGYGVYLTATWILPVALIPGTWQSYDFPSTPTSSDSPPSNNTPTVTIPATPSTPSESKPADPPSTPSTSPAVEAKSGLWKYLRGG